MKIISDENLMKAFIDKHNITDIFNDFILQHAILQFFNKGETILHAGFSLEYYCILVSGKIKISYLFENGKSIVLKFYKDYNTMGDIEILKEQPIRCDVFAEEDSYIIAIPARLLREHAYNDPKFLHHVIDSLSGKFFDTLNNSSYNLTYPLINRFSSFLNEYADNNPIILTSSFKDIAQFLGTTYRHLNRTIKDMENKGIIRCDDKRIHILDLEELKELSRNTFRSL